jgi:hypothetical protein
MPRQIMLAASLPDPPDRLFDMYLDPEATGVVLLDGVAGTPRRGVGAAGGE